MLCSIHRRGICPNCRRTGACSVLLLLLLQLLLLRQRIRF